MSRNFLFVWLLVMASVPMWLISAANDTGVALSYRAKSDFALTADPNTAAWKNIPQGKRIIAICKH